MLEPEFSDKTRFTDNPLADLEGVMRHHDLRFVAAYGELTITNMLDLLAEISSKNEITADDIKPEK